MKKILYLLVGVLCLGIASCSKDDENGEDNVPGETIGSDNKTDLAVTGGLAEYGMSYADILGYVNVDPTIATYLESVGVEISLTEDFRTSEHINCNGLTGNQFSVTTERLEPNTTYFYRTYVQTGIYNYGKTLSFTTKALPTLTPQTGSAEGDVDVVLRGTMDTSDIGERDRNILECGFVYSKNQSSIKESSYFSSDDVKKATQENGEYTVMLKDIELGSTFFYAMYVRICGGKYQLGQIKSFTTLSIEDNVKTNIKWSDMTTTKSVYYPESYTYDFPKKNCNITFQSDLSSRFPSKNVRYGVQFDVWGLCEEYGTPRVRYASKVDGNQYSLSYCFEDNMYDSYNLDKYYSLMGKIDAGLGLRDYEIEELKGLNSFADVLSKKYYIASTFVEFGGVKYYLEKSEQK